MVSFFVYANFEIIHLQLKSCRLTVHSIKHNVLEEYRREMSGSEFKSLAKRFKIKGGHKFIMS